ncbi:MAG: hypothetical protein HYY00_07135 [Chloroflexi bacterium]|nr:hypothetical protein [Chloroflexota bacterium]
MVVGIVASPVHCIVYGIVDGTGRNINRASATVVGRRGLEPTATVCAGPPASAAPEPTIEKPIGPVAA